MCNLRRNAFRFWKARNSKYSNQSGLRERLTSDPFAFVNPGLGVREEREKVDEMADGRTKDAIVVRNLTKEYRSRGKKLSNRCCTPSKRTKAVDSMNFSASSGVWGLLGTNGAGKIKYYEDTIRANAAH